MTELADAIVLYVGFWQWRRMNGPRFYRRGLSLRVLDFMDDMRVRVDLLGDADDNQVVTYLLHRLTSERLALPDDCQIGRDNISDRKYCLALLGARDIGNGDHVRWLLKAPRAIDPKNPVVAEIVREVRDWKRSQMLEAGRRYNEIWKKKGLT